MDAQKTESSQARESRQKTENSRSEESSRTAEDSEAFIRSQLGNTLTATDCRELLKAREFYKGKVRDNYILGDGKRVIIVTDRISCFDVVVGTVPFKGQVLNQMAAFWFDKTRGIVCNHVISVPDPNAMVVQECKPVVVEMIVRQYITGSLWRAYASGARQLYGITFPDGLKKNQRFDSPLITPTTKAEHGQHDAPLSRNDIIGKGLVDAGLYKRLEEVSLRLFAAGSEVAQENGLLLVDTKYEFGLRGKELVLIDEIHTPDSSRFWYAAEYDESFGHASRQAGIQASGQAGHGREPKLLDKEYVRQWLLAKGFSGTGTAPELTDEVRIEAAKRYIEAFEQITGTRFAANTEPVSQRLQANLRKHLDLDSGE